MAHMNGTESTPVNVSFSGAALESLDDIRIDTKAKDITQVVLDALMVYSALLNVSDNDNTVIVQDKRGNRIKLTLYPDRRRRNK